MILLRTVGSALGALFAGIDAVTVGLWRRLREVLSLRGPLESVAFWVLLVGTGAVVVVEDVARLADRAVAALERAFVLVALLAMTFLVTDEYLARELKASVGDLGGLFAIDGLSNFALLLMVMVGFLGASLATRRREHLSVDALHRALSPPAARFVKRVVGLVSAGLCLVFLRGAWDATFSHSQDTFEGAVVYGWAAPAINAVVPWLPGEKYGPPSCKAVPVDDAARAAAGCPAVDFATSDAWTNAKYDAGLDPFQLYAFGYVDAGDRFPLWVPLLFLVGAFGLISLRFLGQAASPGAVPDAPVQGTRKPADVLLAGAIPGALAAMCAGAVLGKGWLVLGASLGLVLLGAPLFVAVGVGTLCCWVLLRDGSAETVVLDMFEATKKQELLSIPFFVLAGNLMTRGTIASRLIEVARALVGAIPGGLGVGGIAACAFFAAISGSSPVTVIAIGGIMFPLLLRNGYPERYAIGMLTTAGGLGIIIPPSIPMIVYAVIVGGNPAVGAIDPAVLFKAGIGPGLFIAAVLATVTFFQFWPREGLALPDRPATEVLGGWLAHLLRTLLRGLPALFLPVLILGGIYGWLSIGGVTLALTVTEAAALSVAYALFVELVVHRELKLRELPDVFADTAVQMGSLFLILVIAISLNRYFVFEQLPDAATAWVVSWVDSKLGFLIAANLFLLALGCVMDILSAILIVAPLLAPIAAQYGIHPVHFGIMFIVNLEIGYLTPPMGINLFVASTTFERPLIDVIRAVVPYLFVMLACLLVIVFVPALSLWLVTP